MFLVLTELESTMQSAQADLEMLTFTLRVTKVHVSLQLTLI